MSWSRGPNLFVHPAAPPTGEVFEELARLGPTLIERIVSSAQPDPTPYDQPQDEWVVLMRGEARLEVAGTEVAMTSGDTLLIPRHTPHRVLMTSPGALWLAVHTFPIA